MDKYVMWENVADAFGRIAQISLIVMAAGFIISPIGVALMVVGVIKNIELMIAIGIYSQFALIMSVIAFFASAIFDNLEDWAIRRMWSHFDGNTNN